MMLANESIIQNEDGRFKTLDLILIKSKSSKFNCPVLILDHVSKRKYGSESG